MQFNELNLHHDLLSGVDAMNYIQMSPIQELTIPIILAGKDLIASAQTGTGKTAAYLIPLLDQVIRSQSNQTSALVLVPTRELAKQIDEQIEGFSYFINATSIAIYGGGKGEDWDQQRKALVHGADIIIATPGRLMAHMKSGEIKFDHIKCLVLDEADKMLDMGFSDDILFIIKHLPAKRQNLMFSATMPKKIRDFANKILNHPEEVRLATSKPAEGIDQQFYLANDTQKIPLLAHLLKSADVQSVIIFSSQKMMIDKIIRALTKLKWDARGISSDNSQEERENVLRDFKNKQYKILVATDVLSRGIDINNLSHVINFDVPRDAEDYIHRIGRTARAETTGTAITFINEKDQYRIRGIEKLLEKEVEKQSITESLGLGPAPEYKVASTKKEFKKSSGHKNKSKRRFFRPAKKPSEN
ncbi:DEAD/DEAH box helicase [Emticicia sp. BO119]|uniref:DEAD/DEAH box helicase n=1 Tax=Emticicia sp. BO119 TaxID=2757768 RepID=UPI001E486E80|nr:DEAD/DEAH box helicase [Emticicia sp. BO119]